MPRTAAQIVLALAVLALFVIACVRPWRSILRFSDLTDDEQLNYLEYANSIDALLTRRYLRQLPVRLGVACFTLGLGLLLSSLNYHYRKIENKRAKRVAKAHVRDLQRAYERHRVGWTTFPGSQAFVYEWRREVPSRPGRRCPACKGSRLRIFRRTSAREILNCGRCAKSLVIEGQRLNGAVLELLIPGVLSHSVALTSQFDSLDSIGDIGGIGIDGISLFDLF